MKCHLCNHSDIFLFLDLGSQPLANKYPKKENFETEDFFPLQIFFCKNCKNVQLGKMISRERMFEDYYYLSSVNPGLVRHFEDLAKKLISARFVVDVGSNDGILLKPLKQLGVKAVGVDPSINVSKIANDYGLTTLTSFFNSETSEKIKKDFESPDIVVASSIFTHVENPHQFIEDIKKVMADDGVFILEVEYIGNILVDIQFERFYLDRIFYYSLTSLSKLFAGHGMYISDVEKIEPHGGSLRIFVRKNGSDFLISDAVKNLLDEEETTLNSLKLEDFKQKVYSYISAFREKLNEYKKAGLKVAGYSAPARVATICNYGNIDSSLIEFIIDDSPLKQNRFSPGTHIPIVPKTYLDEHKPDILVVFAYEYLDDIKKKTNNSYRYLIPIPPREVV
ncbi:MAG: class I SAM-dependent methyltransferase [Patescibacteria group bacterium]